MLHNQTNPRKVDLTFDNAGAPVLTMIEVTPQGNLHYYMQQDGSWRQYDPSITKPEPFSNDRFTAWIDPTDWQLPK